uniref:BHLH domain-containing protein n=1 Tax=Opuntia streptacantha TaxID=393608 RepID=A0A7C8YHM8_OPUST
MFQGEQATYYCAEYLTGCLLSSPGDGPGDVIGVQGLSGDGTEAAGGLFEAQVKTIYESLTADTIAGVSRDVASLMTKPLTEPCIERNYHSTIGSAGLPSSMQSVNFKNESLETPVHLNHWAPEGGTISTLTIDMMEWQQSGFAPSNMQLGKITTSGSPPMPSRSISRKARQRSKEFESHRRFMVAEKLRALQEFLPATLKVSQDSVHSNRESILDNTIGYIRYLELQLKDLSASRLGGESISAPLFFLEGHGHYYPHDKFFGEALEEVFGELIEENQTAACELLESKGLHMVPIGSIHALCGAE